MTEPAAAAAEMAASPSPAAAELPSPSPSPSPRAQPDRQVSNVTTASSLEETLGGSASSGSVAARVSELGQSWEVRSAVHRCQSLRKSLRENRTDDVSKAPDISRVLLRHGMRPSSADAVHVCSAPRPEAELHLAAAAEGGTEGQLATEALALCPPEGWRAGMLVAHGAKMNALTTHGVPVLTWYATRLNSECCEALLAAGADPNVPSPQGVTPLQAALQARLDAGRIKPDEALQETVRVLASHGAVFEMSIAERMHLPKMAKTMRAFGDLSKAGYVASYVAMLLLCPFACCAAQAYTPTAVEKAQTSHAAACRHEPASEQMSDIASEKIADPVASLD